MLSIEEYEAGVREERGIRYYQTMPPLKADEYEELRADIRANGITVPVIVDEHGNVIDGHHRTMIARELGIDYPRVEVTDLSESEKLSMSVSLNIKRRQLSREEKRQVIAAQLKAQPEKSNREHAKSLGVDDKTVGAVRRNLQSTAEIPQFDRTVGADGKERPASRPTPPAEPDEADDIPADTITGEVVDGRREYADDENGIYIVDDSDDPEEFWDAVDNEPEPSRTITGLDGKSYQKSEPMKPRRRPLPDQSRTAGWDLAKSLERIERILADDRFNTHKEEVATHLRSHLTNAIDSCQGFLDRINN